MSRRAGMTLLEVIVALAVAGAALVAGTSVLGFLADQESREGAQRLASAGAVRSQLREWISSAHLATAGDAAFRGLPASGRSVTDDNDAGADDELTFVTSAPTDASATETLVRIHMERSDTARIRGLVASISPWRGGGAMTTIALAPEATGFRAHYLGTLDSPKWTRRWESISVLPAGVELEIQLPSDNLPAHAMLGIPLRVALGARR